MKKLTKLTIKKITLRDLDDSVIDGVAGAAVTNVCKAPTEGCTDSGATCVATCRATCFGNTCPEGSC